MSSHTLSPEVYVIYGYRSSPIVTTNSVGLQLEAFDFKIRHVPGVENEVLVYIDLFDPITVCTVRD